MKIRTIGAILGLLAGVAVFAAVASHWPQAADAIGLGGTLAGGAGRLAWSVSLGIGAFAAIASVVALIGGLAETAGTRRLIDPLRHDPAFADRWNAADWRAVFAGTAVAEQAEAMIALIPVDKGDARRVVVDTPILLALNDLWLDRLTLAAVVRPLPALVLGFAGALALRALVSGGRWDVAAAAGAAGWLIVSLAAYLARIALKPSVDKAVAAATAAVRPLSSMQAAQMQAVQVPAAPTPGIAAAAGNRIAHEEAEIIAAALSNVIWEPLGRLADAAEKLAAPEPQSRDKAIEAALAEVKAGIERLLADKGGDAHPY